MKLVPEQVARFVPDRPFIPLGTDGFGRSDTREALRRFFEVDTPHVVVAVLHGLAERGEIKTEAVVDAINRYGLTPDPPPRPPPPPPPPRRYPLTGSGRAPANQHRRAAGWQSCARWPTAAIDN